MAHTPETPSIDGVTPPRNPEKGLPASHTLSESEEQELRDLLRTAVREEERIEQSDGSHDKQQRKNKKRGVGLFGRGRSRHKAQHSLRTALESKGVSTQQEKEDTRTFEHTEQTDEGGGAASNNAQLPMEDGASKKRIQPMTTIDATIRMQQRGEYTKEINTPPNAIHTHYPVAKTPEELLAQHQHVSGTNTKYETRTEEQTGNSEVTTHKERLERFQEVRAMYREHLQKLDAAKERFYQAYEAYEQKRSEGSILGLSFLRESDEEEKRALEEAQQAYDTLLDALPALRDARFSAFKEMHLADTSPHDKKEGAHEAEDTQALHETKEGRMQARVIAWYEAAIEARTEADIREIESYKALKSETHKSRFQEMLKSKYEAYRKLPLHKRILFGLGVAVPTAMVSATLAGASTVAVAGAGIGAGVRRISGALFGTYAGTPLALELKRSVDAYAEKVAQRQKEDLRAHLGTMQEEEMSPSQVRNQKLAIHRARDRKKTAGTIAASGVVVGASVAGASVASDVFDVAGSSLPHTESTPPQGAASTETPEPTTTGIIEAHTDTTPPPAPEVQQHSESEDIYVEDADDDPVIVEDEVPTDGQDVAPPQKEASTVSNKTFEAMHVEDKESGLTHHPLLDVDENAPDTYSPPIKVADGSVHITLDEGQESAPDTTVTLDGVYEEGSSVEHEIQQYLAQDDWVRTHYPNLTAEEQGRAAHLIRQALMENKDAAQGFNIRHNDWDIVWKGDTYHVEIPRELIASQLDTVTGHATATDMPESTPPQGAASTETPEPTTTGIIEAHTDTTPPPAPEVQQHSESEDIYVEDADDDPVIVEDEVPTDGQDVAPPQKEASTVSNKTFEAMHVEDKESVLVPELREGDFTYIRDSAQAAEVMSDTPEVFPALPVLNTLFEKNIYTDTMQGASTILKENWDVFGVVKVADALDRDGFLDFVSTSGRHFNVGEDAERFLRLFIEQTARGLEQDVPDIHEIVARAAHEGWTMRELVSEIGNRIGIEAVPGGTSSTFDTEDVHSVMEMEHSSVEAEHTAISPEIAEVRLPTPGTEPLWPEARLFVEHLALPGDIDHAYPTAIEAFAKNTAFRDHLNTLIDKLADISLESEHTTHEQMIVDWDAYKYLKPTEALARMEEHVLRAEMHATPRSRLPFELRRRLG